MFGFLNTLFRSLGIHRNYALDYLNENVRKFNLKEE